MNRLQHETSPYLRQHADNPVDWYPWGAEALQKAQAKDKPILLSIGYSSCHWCHVMAHESFEDVATARLMNDLFVNIKVDREERPDVDDVYMQAVQTFTRGHGGWPMTVFLLPDGRPFYGGTYFPREARQGMPPFQQVLQSVAAAFQNRRNEIESQADNITKSLDRSLLNIEGAADGLNAELLETAADQLQSNFDLTYGGFGRAPKFPQPMTLEFMLRGYQRTKRDDLLLVVTRSLRQMARGGIYDQLGGGFHRYSVDAMWLVPHFEKMLYDNAQLSRLYLHAYQATGDEFYRRIAEDIYKYILREMTSPEGGFYSATDADSEGVEGKFFVWDKDEIETILGDESHVAVDYWGITARGNFEGKNILCVPKEDDKVAQRLDFSEDELRAFISAVKYKLYAHRARRVAPALDDKIITAWNAMMLASIAEAARVLQRQDLRDAAVVSATFLTQELMTEDGRLLRTHKAGESKINGYLEDYANMIDALLEVYQTTFDEQWFSKARQLADYVLAHFTAEDGGFFDTADDHEALIVRPRNLQDNATPSGNSMIAKQLVRLSAYTGDTAYYDAAAATLDKLAGAMKQYPQAFPEALNAADMLVNGLAEVAVVGDPQDERTRALLAVAQKPYRPNVIVALTPQDVEGDQTVPLLDYRMMRAGQPTVYVCEHFACKLPVVSPDEVEQLLA